MDFIHLKKNYICLQSCIHSKSTKFHYEGRNHIQVVTSLFLLSTKYLQDAKPRTMT